jgi:phenylacetate-coenzyme A ligase PaaK-like adenylate-forming protein
MEITPLEDWTASKLRVGDALNLLQLHEYQLGKLRQTLQHVLSNSRFYSKHLSGLDPSSV